MGLKGIMVCTEISDIGAKTWHCQLQLVDLPAFRILEEFKETINAGVHLTPRFGFSNGIWSPLRLPIWTLYAQIKSSAFMAFLLKYVDASRSGGASPSALSSCVCASPSFGLDLGSRKALARLPDYDFGLCTSHARALLPAALASVSFGFVLVRVQVRTVFLSSRLCGVLYPTAQSGIIEDSCLTMKFYKRGYTPP